MIIMDLTSESKKKYPRDKDHCIWN